MRFDDSDIKIAPDDPSEVFDTSEGAAAAFAAAAPGVVIDAAVFVKTTQKV